MGQVCVKKGLEVKSMNVPPSQLDFDPLILTDQKQKK